MNRDRHRGSRVPLLSFLLLAFIVVTTVGQSPDQANSANQAAEQASQPDSQLVKRGKYIVHHVAMCIECHTPKNMQGELIESRLLTGATIPVDNPYPDHLTWAFKAPRLAGLPGGWSEESLIEFLQTGKSPTGFSIRPPMPPFRMTEDDAKAVVAYLQSLARGP